MVKAGSAITTIAVLILVVIVVYYVYKNFKIFGSWGAGLGQVEKDISTFFTDGLTSLEKGFEGAGADVSGWWQGFYNKYLNKPILPIAPPLTRSSIDKILKGGGSQGAATDGTDTPAGTSETTPTDIPDAPATPVDVTIKGASAVGNQVSVVVNNGFPPTVSQIVSKPTTFAGNRVVDPTAIMDRITKARSSSNSAKISSLDVGSGQSNLKPVQSSDQVMPVASLDEVTKVQNPLTKAPNLFDEIVAEFSKDVQGVTASLPLVPRPVAPVIEGVSVG